MANSELLALEFLIKSRPVSKSARNIVDELCMS